MGRGNLLLSRDEFRTRVLARDAGRCCVPDCDQPATDAHHIINRNLWHGPDERGGYFLANGAALCEPHHLMAERTQFSCEQLRTWSGIATRLLPEHLADGEYDTWGNPTTADGRRLPGELFTSPGCQSALHAGGVLALFDLRWKYPRTFHLPWSPGRSADDRVMPSVRTLTEAAEVVMTVKMDGEATTIYSDGYCHARSVDSTMHPSRSWVRALAATIGPQLPSGWRISGEYLFARHSISYTELPSYFLVYSIWVGDRCLSWDDTVEWAELLDLHTVPVLYRGAMLNESGADAVFAEHRSTHEGYVIRDAAEFTLAEFPIRVGKWVRQSHVQTGAHWMSGPVVANELAAPLS